MSERLVEVRRLIPESQAIECPWCGGGGIIMRLIYNRDYPPVEMCRECGGEGIVDGSAPEHAEKARLEEVRGE